MNIIELKECQKPTDEEDIFACLEIFKEANKTYPLPESSCLVKSSTCESCTEKKIKVYSNLLIDKHKVELGLLSPKNSRAHKILKHTVRRDYDNSMFSELQKLEKVNIDLPKAQSLTIGCIIHSFNNRKNIDQLYNGLQDIDFDEIIICEDGSSDGSKEKWEEYSQKDKRIKIRYSRNIHELRCFDFAIREASSDVCCLFQGDDIIPDDKGIWFEQGKELLEVLPILVVLGGMASINIHKVVCPERFIREDRFARGSLEVSSLTVNKIPFTYIMAAIVGPYFVRRSSYIELGGFEIIHKVGKPSIFHDLLFGVKVWDNGYKVGMYKTIFNKPCGSCKRLKEDEAYKSIYYQELCIDTNYFYLNYTNEKLDEIKKDIVNSNLLLRSA